MKKEEVKYIKLDPSYIDEIMEIKERVYKYLREETTLEIWDEEYPQRVHFLDDLENRECRGLSIDNKLVAYITFVDANDYYDEKDRENPFESDKTIALFRLMTDVSLMNKGLGTLLMAKTIEEIKENYKENYDNIGLFVSKDNLKATRIYEKLGFKRTNEETLFWDEYYSYELKF